MCWNVEENLARLQCGRLRGSVVIDAYRARFNAECWNGHPIESLTALGYFGVDANTKSLKLVESYARGGDFVATFAEIGKGRIAPQLYWRASFLEQIATTKLELLISVKTDLLDSRPVSWTCSYAGAEATAFHTASLKVSCFEVINVSPTRRGEITVWHPGVHFSQSMSREHLFVFRLKGQDLSFAQMVHPSDFVSAQVDADMQLSYCLSASLFPEHLEKGVIRRGRVCGWFMPAENDLQTAVELARQFVDEPLPLTT